jgi:two-component system, OmpR family, phosphate regulon sensor histidine kinase PhoR
LNQRKFLWKIYFIYAALSIIPLILLGLYTSSLFKDSLINIDTKALSERTALIKERLETSGVNTSEVQKFVMRYDNLSGARVTLIEPSGKVIADSRENYAEMDNHADRPEIKEALTGNTGVSQRYSFTLKEDFLYSAMPVYNNEGRITYIIRTGYPMSFVTSEVASANTAIILTVIFFGLIILVLGYLLIHNILTPLSEIKTGAERFSKGDFSQKIFPPNESELKSIAESLNTMAKQLDEKLDIIGEQSNLQDVVLKSMKEGVLAVDYDERILLLNKTAAEILAISDANTTGKTLQEVVRISEIQKFFKNVISEEGPHEAEIILQHDKDKFLQLSGTLLYDMDNKALGALVVFNDITNLKHLDTLKKELVANVSHELRTPVTTIKGFIETLKEGAIEDPKNAERFLNIVDKHIDRLNMLIDDLLILSKLEESPDEIKVEEETIKPVLKSVVEDYEFKANEKKIEIEIKCDDNLSAKINKHLMEQAIGNLVDNAIKYSDKKTKVEIGAYEKNGMVNIYVEDEGYGISEEHMPRLFERFYRIDKARSREEGGTGLGLAIVKHIVNTMNGHIDVKSTPGKRTIFTIKIPQNG